MDRCSVSMMDLVHEEMTKKEKEVCKDEARNAKIHFDRMGMQGITAAFCNFLSSCLRIMCPTLLISVHFQTRRRIQGSSGNGGGGRMNFHIS